MRFLDLSAAVAAVALVQGTGASPQQPYNGQTTSAVTTYYSTMTVFRVETTVTATRNGSVSTYESTSTETSALVYPTTFASAAATIPASNNTASILGTGAQPTGVEASTGGASMLSIGSIAAAAVAGVVGICLL